MDIKAVSYTHLKCLCLNNPKFSVGKLENILYVDDETEICDRGCVKKVPIKYLVDLSYCTYKQIE